MGSVLVSIIAIDEQPLRAIALAGVECQEYQDYCTSLIIGMDGLESRLAGSEVIINLQTGKYRPTSIPGSNQLNPGKLKKIVLVERSLIVRP